MKYLIFILLSLCSYSIDLSGQIIMPTPGKIERADGRLRLQGKIRMYAEESPGSYIRLFYEKLVPESAVLISQEKEDGFTSFEYWVDSSQEFVEILIDPATQQLQRVEYEQRNDNGSATVALSKEDAQLLDAAGVP